MLRSKTLRVLCATLGLGALVCGSALVAHAQTAAAQPERVIKIVAQRFEYTPSEIAVKKGEAVVLEFTALDFEHGFKVPNLDIRADLQPGQVTRVRIQPMVSGSYDFLCDNFCGYGHEDMSGHIVVSD